jgi:ATP-binding cassette, subfamily F, member 3
MIHITALHKDFAGRCLFNGVSWRIGRSERIGLVGENGTGKSTLMKIIAGLEEPSSGTMHLAKGTTIGYLPQQGIAVTGRTLFAEAMAALDELQEIEAAMSTITATLSGTTGVENSELLLQQLGSLEEEFRVKGGYSREATVGTVLKGLGFAPEDWDKECGTFSGGWQMRIALARLLLRQPTLLLLDEPTNHLDIEARNWLESYLCGYPHAVLLVSHDRYFMDQVCRRITEVWNQTLTDYVCTYSRYLVEREERVTRLREAKRRQDEEIAKIEDFISRFRFKADKAALVQSRIKQLEKIERIVLPPERKRISFSFPDPPRSGRVVMELAQVTKAYGDHVVLDGISLTVERGEKISLVGHNGAGKSTLMRVLAGDTVQAGERIVGANVCQDYFAQDQASALDGTRTVYEELLADAPYDRVPVLRDVLGAFLFSGDDIHKKVAVLSGGEQSRLALAKMLLRPSNLLLLDEPTNHLDLFSKDVLLDALQSFTGSVVFVSHDRYFINALATRTVAVGGGSIRSYYGNYDEYLASCEGEVGNGSPLTSRGGIVSHSAEDLVSASRKLDRQLSREEDKRRQREERARQKKLAELEEQIDQCETELVDLEQTMAAVDYFCDAARARNGTQRHEYLTCRIAELYDEWESVHGAAVA